MTAAVNGSPFPKGFRSRSPPQNCLIKSRNPLNKNGDGVYCLINCAGN